jgi:hypothetical protein
MTALQKAECIAKFLNDTCEGDKVTTQQVRILLEDTHLLFIMSFIRRKMFYMKDSWQGHITVGGNSGSFDIQGVTDQGRKKVNEFIAGMPPAL